MNMTHVDTPQSLCRFGVARGDITPPVGIYHRMWGAATHERATGVHRPLTAMTLVLQAAEGAIGRDTEQIVVALDLCLLWAKETDELLRAICAGAAVAREQIAVTFSHTHAAGLMGLERQTLPGGEMIAPYLSSLGQKVSALVGEARASARPAVIAYATGRCTLAAQRDFWDQASGQFVCGFNPSAFADDTVLVGRVTTPDGSPLVSIVNYACHPTTLAWQNTLISPDFPGAMRELVEKSTGAPCKAQAATSDRARDSSAIRPSPIATAGSWRTRRSRHWRRYRRRSRDFATPGRCSRAPRSARGPMSLWKTRIAGVSPGGGSNAGPWTCPIARICRTGRKHYRTAITGSSARATPAPLTMRLRCAIAARWWSASTAA
jgi:hypothetical protein